ncbi:uncharacterized protein YndB with AHSA1/START domain [Jatrophihabitans sp. GAS493]|uniref:SRPBCC domain-containing protein n=1 Tax=Jatrophihabitans sp. GAS493 TaxID=1907575 RepID=UPI000BB72251|nr:SRPBCC domain-containing protein [Jatrophihabitans sp. GAS493]SOD73939.1 uncharacterized protein YndB with AHSA1/START domain [Jatrophihabitans sp. GAS493]
MEYGNIEREFHVDALPEVVFDVISNPVHVKEWWGADSDFEATPGHSGELVWGSEDVPRQHVTPFTVVDAEPPRLFSFRWAYGDATAGSLDNSLLVTFELAPSAGGTTVRLTESGFREMGWDAAVLEHNYNDHVQGWTTYLAALARYAAEVVSAR